MGPVALTTSDPDWPAAFRAERHRLTPPLGALAQQLEHVGSTAVPSLIAKPVIDMMAPVPSLAMADDLAPALPGYVLAETDFTKRRLYRREVEGLGYHLHLVICPDWPLKNELLFRDWLRAHPDEARAYGVLKLRLAEEFPTDVAAYTQAKGAFIRNVVNRARKAQGLERQVDWTE